VASVCLVAAGRKTVTPIAIAVLAFSMSVDAFALCLARGATRARPGFTEALRTGFVFGAVEATTPLIGWAAGMAAVSYVQSIDHWIAFLLLGGVGLHMLYAATQHREEVQTSAPSLLLLIAAAITTSLDAMAVGVSLAVLNVDIVTIAIAIGIATFLMSSAGVMLGRFVGERLGRATEVLAGIGLCVLGTVILIEHLA